MLNGHFNAWTQEAAQHWQHVLAAAGTVRSALPVQEWIKIGAVAVVTAVLTSTVTLARIEERVANMQSERALLLKKRDEQVTKIEARLDRIEAAITDLKLQFAGRRK